MNRTKTFFLNFIMAFVLQIVTLIAGFLIPKIMLTYYGSEANGLVSSITQFINYFNLVEAGLSAAAIISLYKPLAENDQDRVSVVVTTVKNFYYKVGFMFTGLVVVLAIIYPLVIKSSLFSFIDIFILVIILGGNSFLNFFTLAKYSALLTADQKLYIISFSTILYYILNILIIYYFSKNGYNIISVRFFSLFSLIIRSIFINIYVKKKYKYINYNSKIDKNCISKRWDALYLQILGSIQLGFPIVILTFFCDLKTVSIFTIYNMILTGINGILSIFVNGLSSSFGNIIAKNEKLILKTAIEEFEYIYYNILTIAYTISLLLIMPFIKIYTAGINDANYYIPLVGTLFVINGLLFNIKTPQGMLVIAGGLYKETRIQSTIQAIIIIVFGLILTPNYGIIGILIALIISNVYRDIDLLIFIPKKLTNNSIKKTLIKQIKIFILSFMIYIICNFIKFDISSYIKWIGCAIIYIIIACSTVLIYDVIFDRNNLKKIIKRFKIMLGVKK